MVAAELLSSELNCGTGGECSGVAVYSPVLLPPYLGAYPTVGCYAHSTHIAGIVGANADNNGPRAGVYAGVNMVSIAIGTSAGTYNSAWIPCAKGGFGDLMFNGVLTSAIEIGRAHV